MKAMVNAGFSSVFVGIETPSSRSLRGAGKTQNLRRDLSEAVTIMTKNGLEIMGGFIVGFDQDDESIFEDQRKFIQSSPIALAMVGLLTALPGTALTRRLEREKRLRHDATGDQFGRPNFDRIMDEATLLRGYAGLMAALYDPAAYYERCERYLACAPRQLAAKKKTLADVATLFRTFFHVGVRSPRRWRYWRLLARTLWTAPHHMSRAVSQAVQGEHMIRYTREELLPRMEAALAELACAPKVPARGPARVPFIERGIQLRPSVTHFLPLMAL